MGECKTKSIQKDLGTLRHNKTYPGIIHEYSGIFRTLCYLDIYETVAYPEPWYIQKRKHIQNPGILTTLVHSEPRYTQNAGIFKIWGIFRTLPHIYEEALIIFTAIIIFTNQLLSQNLPCWSKYLEVVCPEVVTLCKKLWRARGNTDRECLIYLLIYSNKLAYLQLITVLVYRSSPPKSHEQGYLNF